MGMDDKVEGDPPRSKEELQQTLKAEREMNGILTKSIQPITLYDMQPPYAVSHILSKNSTHSEVFLLWVPEKLQ